MSTPINLATEVYPGPGGANSAVLSGGKLVPFDPLSPASSIIIAAPHIGAGGSGSVNVTGTFHAPSFALYSALSADINGLSVSNGGHSFNYTLRDSLGSGAATTQTFSFPFGTGVEQYDDAITAGEDYILLNPAHWTEITAISYDYTEPGGALLPAARRGRGAAPLRQYPRTPLRIYPAPKSYQASNRRGGGYL